MKFRAKSTGRVLSELAELATRYRSFQFEAVDNILDNSYFHQFFPRLIESRADYRFFYEVKANLTRDKLKTLSQGGVYRIQPGIESLSTRILNLMRKGVSAIQNVNTLRWALYHKITVAWNLLWGFPGEKPDDYRQQLTVIKQIVHLQPPGSEGRIWMERFSPIYRDRDLFHARFVRPEASYSHVYPSCFDLDRIAYFFDYEFVDTMPDSSFEDTVAAVRQWREAWNNTPRPTLTFWSTPGFLQIEDRRAPDTAGTYTFENPLAALYVACSDRARGITDLNASLSLGRPEPEIEEALNGFVDRGLMMRDGRQFLSLGLPARGGR